MPEPTPTRFNSARRKFLTVTAKVAAGAVVFTTLANNTLDLIERLGPPVRSVARRLAPGSGEFKVASTDGLSIRVHDSVHMTESLNVRVANTTRTNARGIPKL